MRDNLCALLAIGPRYGNNYFNFINLEYFSNCILSNYDNIPLTHVAVIIKQFFLHFIQICPSDYYNSIQPFLAMFLTKTLERLENEWQNYNKITNINNQNNDKSIQLCFFFLFFCLLCVLLVVF